MRWLKLMNVEDVVVKEFNPDTGTLDVIQGKGKAIQLEIDDKPKQPVPQYRIQGTMNYGSEVPKTGFDRVVYP